ncbi:hypothetical protein EXIGLDRAFT_773422 [Exidia glandulosa HHB12029]|uniref:Uncharacterized protein n=1 Tax=Exidia glandulosa HHB12029 TaxID=1314781 RepID=A0A165EF52_EXIGL|nr:hypothetical protein EXIGLDRAFT_774892 [Exidia glandulosa HHB12029]KZV86790.1 hypothetical protein EXIGLDRAFT_774268 [Exidia glandulosa HHB12029]KZV87707.1 hypothetical protein EXIGLDRAFT_773422 [Exidia glandulosa HHB12029]
MTGPPSGPAVLARSRPFISSVGGIGGERDGITSLGLVVCGTGPLQWLSGEGALAANGYSNGLCVLGVANGVPRNVGCGCGDASGGIWIAEGRVMDEDED